MNISSVGGAYNLFQAQAAQRTPEAAEIQKAGRDNDGDADDKKIATGPTQPSTAVNLSGQRVGQVINVVA